MRRLEFQMMHPSIQGRKNVLNNDLNLEEIDLIKWNDNDDVWIPNKGILKELT